MNMTWTDWLAIAEAVRAAPRSPGVYMARAGGNVVYIGRAGDRRGAGVAGRLRAYASGKSPDSGLIGKAVDRALADVAFTHRICERARDGRPTSLRAIAVAALDHLGIEVRSAATEAAPSVERDLIASYPAGQLWNVR